MVYNTRSVSLLALERILSAVQPLVLRQVVLVFESFRAHVTLVRPTCIWKLMGYNVVCYRAARAADIRHE